MDSKPLSGMPQCKISPHKKLVGNSCNICDFVSVSQYYGKSHNFSSISNEDSVDDFIVTDSFFS